MEEPKPIWWGVAQGSRFILRGTRQISNLFFIIYIVLALYIGDRWPWMVSVLGAAMILAGVPLFLYGSRKIGEYKNIYDYEPTRFWGKETNGKEAREVLAGLNAISFWCVLTGLITGIALVLRFLVTQ